MIAGVLSDPTVRMLEQTVNFTEQRHQVLLEDIANVSTPGYVQRDLPVAKFQATLQDAISRERQSLNGAYEPSSDQDLSFEPGGSEVDAASTEQPQAVAFHDRGIRSMEYLMGQMADNALSHNMAAQLLKTRYDWISRAISMKP